MYKTYSISLDSAEVEEFDKRHKNRSMALNNLIAKENEAFRTDAAPVEKSEFDLAKEKSEALYDEKREAEKEAKLEALRLERMAALDAGDTTKAAELFDRMKAIVAEDKQASS